MMALRITALLVLLGLTGLAQAPPHTLYVANQGADTISIVDGATFAVTATIPTGKNPHEILLDLPNGVLYATNRQENTVSVIDVQTNKERTRISAPGAPHGITLSPDGKTLFATGRQEINVIDLVTRELMAPIPVGQAPHMLHRSPDKTRIYTGNMRDGTISVIDIATRKVIATVPVGRTPEDLAISPDGREILVGNQDDDSLTVIDAATNAVIETVKLPERGAPIRIRYTPDGKTVFIASRRDGAGVLRMDRATRKITGHLAMDGVCVGMNFTPDQRVLYVTDLRGGTIAQVDIDALKILKTLPTGAGADAIEVVAGR